MRHLDAMRGLDLSGSLQGAGGIGGLLAMTEASGTSSYYHHDASGSITALMDANENMVGRAEYNAFGRLINSTGSKMGINPLWQSAQLYHSDIDVISYLYRPYLPGLQRWLNQDPIQERGGINLYGFVKNDPINKIDPLGLQIPPPVINALESPEAQELEEVIVADAEAAAEATEAEMSSLMQKAREPLP